MHPIILLADDHSSISIGLKRQIEVHFGNKMIHSVRSCSKVMEELKSGKYTHLILDIGLSDGSALEILYNIRQLYPVLHIMLYSAKPASAYESASRKYGIEYYLSKEAEEEETVDGLRRFFNNEPMPYRSSNDDPFSKLAPRELETLYHILKGKGTNEIAALFGLSAKTISEYKKRIHEKTQTESFADLLALATAYNIVD